MTHPLHPAIVHFPIACWSLATIGDVASLWLGRPAWWLAGVSMAIGCVVALAAMAAGLFELARINAASPAMRVARLHLLAAMAAWLSYGASLFLRLDLQSAATALEAPGMFALATSLLGFACLATAGWLGGRLVYQYGVGVEADR